ncbi:MAG TPA: hypothetical protein VG734_04585 [Lacunisphaera sp.]|nr:hypothetical protein [Lacunisphaera sp.]
MRSLAITGFLAAMLATAVGLKWQRQETAELRSQLAQRHELEGQARRLVEKQKSLEAAQVPAAELAARADERAAMTRLLAEVEGIRRRAKAGPEPKPATEPAGGTESLIRKQDVAADAWRNRGARDPVAAVETALWAAAGGDLDTLAGLLALDEKAQAAATAFFGRLPEAMRRELGTPIKLVALFTAQAVPLGSARIPVKLDQDEQTTLITQLTDAKGAMRELQITARPRGDQWQLVVPPEAIDRFSDSVRRPSVALAPMAVP